MKVFAIVLVIACALFSATSAESLEQTKCYPYAEDEEARRHGLTELWEEPRQKGFDLITLYEGCYQLKGAIASKCERRYLWAIWEVYAVFFDAADKKLTYVEQQELSKDVDDTLRRICLS